MKYALTFILMITVCGCGGKKPNDGPTQLSNYATTAIPLPPETPDTTPIKEDLRGIKEDVSAAQGGIRSVIAVAQTSPLPEVKAAIPVLTASDARLTQATAKADKGTADSVLVDAHVAAIKAYYEQAMKAKDDDNARLLKAAQDDAKAATGTITGLNEKIKKMEDEGLQRSKFWINLIGIFCLVGGLGSGLLAIFYNFYAGRMLGMIGVPLGLILITIAYRLTVIIEGIEWIGAISLVTIAVVAAWHYFHHVPALPAPVTVNTAPISETK